MVSTSTEHDLAQLWRELLQLERVDVRHDFFALGGNSLLAGRMLARARQVFSVELSFADVFAMPTVERLAARIDDLRREPVSADVVTDEKEMALLGEKRRRVERALAPDERTRVTPISPSQHNLWLISKLRPDVPLYNEAYQCRLVGEVDVPALRNAFERVVRRHEVLLAHFEQVGSEAVQVVQERDELPFSHHVVDEVPPAERWDAATALRDELLHDALTPTRWPLLRLHVLTTGPDEHLVLLHIHHLVFDGASATVFFHELAEGYRAERSGSVAGLPELPLQYSDFALWQRAQLNGSDGARLVEYWRSQLADLPGELDLPCDRPSAAGPDYSGAEVTVPIPRAVREKVLRLAREENLTPFVVLLTAMCSQLVRRSGHDDVCVGTPAANRVRPGIDGLIGCFVNTLALRTRIAPDSTHREALAHVREVTTGALEHQGLPFERVVAALRPTRRPGRGPFFQVWFATEDQRTHRHPAGEVTMVDFDFVDASPTQELPGIDLSWVVADHGDQMALVLAYRTCMFDEPTVQAMAAEYLSLLEEIVTDQDLSFGGSAQPEGTVAEVVLAMWREALADGSVGPDDDFFEIGGYSMVAVELVSRVQERWGVDVAFADFFDNPTAAGMTALVEAALAESPERQMSVVRSQDERNLDDILAEIDLSVGAPS